MSNETLRDIAALERRWANDPRWTGIKRDYTASDVVSLRPSLKIEHSLARAGAERLWHQLETTPYVQTFGALTGAQAPISRARPIPIRVSTRRTACLPWSSGSTRR